MEVVKNQPTNDEAEQQQTLDFTKLNISCNVSLFCTDSLCFLKYGKSTCK